MQTENNNTETICPRIEGVKQFTVAFKQPYEELPVVKVNLEYVKQIISFIQKELKKLEKAAEENDLANCLDALIDIDYFNLVTALGLGVQDKYQQAFDMVLHANMSKLCSSLEEVQETIAKYEAEGIKCTYAKVLEGKWAVYNSETNKVLKSISFVASDLSVLFK